MMIYFDDGTLTTVKPAVIRVHGDAQAIDKRSTYLGPGSMRGPATQAWYRPPQAQSGWTGTLGGVSQVGPTQRRMYPSQTIVSSAKPRYVPPGGAQIFSPVRLVSSSTPRVKQTNGPYASTSTGSAINQPVQPKPYKKRRRKRGAAPATENKSETDERQQKADPERKALKLRPGRDKSEPSFEAYGTYRKITCVITSESVFVSHLCMHVHRRLPEESRQNFQNAFKCDGFDCVQNYQIVWKKCNKDMTWR